MSTELDTALLKIAKTRLVTEYLEALGSTPEQAATAARGYADQFAFSGAVLTFKGALAGTAEMESKVREWFADNKLEFLIGTPSNNSKVSADAVLVEQARAGNLTARGKLFVHLNRDQAKYDAVINRAPFNAKENDAPVDEAAKENHGKNPWQSGPGFNLSEQGRIFRADPRLAASLAKSAGKTIGAAK
jgi:hypothetical protein